MHLLSGIMLIQFVSIENRPCKIVKLNNEIIMHKVAVKLRGANII